jgi:hypothetical protein
VWSDLIYDKIRSKKLEVSQIDFFESKNKLISLKKIVCHAPVPKPTIRVRVKIQILNGFSSELCEGKLFANER